MSEEVTLCLSVYERRKMDFLPLGYWTRYIVQGSFQPCVEICKSRIWIFPVASISVYVFLVVEEPVDFHGLTQKFLCLLCWPLHFDWICIECSFIAFRFNKTALVPNFPSTDRVLEHPGIRSVVLLYTIFVLHYIQVLLGYD